VVYFIRLGWLDGGQREEVPENKLSQPAIGGFACDRETGH